VPRPLRRREDLPALCSRIRRLRGLVIVVESTFEREFRTLGFRIDKGRNVYPSVGSLEMRLLKAYERAGVLKIVEARPDDRERVSGQVPGVQQSDRRAPHQGSH